MQLPGQEPRKNQKRRPGPAPLITKELLLAAGVRAVSSRPDRPEDLGGALGIQLADVLGKASELLIEQGVSRRGPVAPPVLYKHWRSFDEYLSELVSRLFDPQGFDLSALQNEGASLEAAVSAHALADRDQMSRHDIKLYFSLFGVADREPVQAALRGVYEGYDTAVQPVLKAALHRAGRRPRADLGPGGLAHIAAALTAISEGLILRSVVQSEVADPESLWAEAAVALVMGLSEPVA